MTKYKVAVAHIVWFCHDTTNLKAHDLFMRSVGKEPDSFQSNKVPSGVVPFTSQAIGTSDGAMRLQLSIQPGRAEMAFAPPEVQFSSAGAIIGFKMDQSFEELFSRIAHRSAELLPNVYRVAVVVQAMSPVSDEASGRVGFFNRCGIVDRPEDALDLSFQVNIRKTLAGGTLVNRVVRTAVESFQVFTGQMTPFGPQAQTALGSSEWAITTNLDFNTVPVSTSIDGSTLADLPGALLSEVKSVLSADSFWVGLGARVVQ